LKKKKKHEDRSLKNQILKSEIEKNKLKWKKNQSQYVLTFKTHDANHESETNLIKDKP